MACAVVVFLCDQLSTSPDYIPVKSVHPMNAPSQSLTLQLPHIVKIAELRSHRHRAADQAASASSNTIEPKMVQDNNSEVGDGNPVSLSTKYDDIHTDH